MVSAVLLCAGKSERMGRSKLLLPFKGKVVISVILDALINSKVKNIVTVLRTGDNEILKYIPEDEKIFKTFNPDPEGDMLSSIKCGVKQLLNDSGGVMIFLGEHPLVDVNTVDRIIACFEQTDKKTIIPVYNGRRGHPIILHESLKNEIIGSKLVNGLRDLIVSHENDILELPVDCKGTVLDLDTPYDYEKLLEES